VLFYQTYEQYYSASVTVLAAKTAVRTQLYLLIYMWSSSWSPTTIIHISSPNLCTWLSNKWYYLQFKQKWLLWYVLQELRQTL